MEKVTIHEVKELHLTINEPFCVIQRYMDRTFELIKNVGNDKVLRVYNIEGIKSVIEPLDASMARKVNMLPSATESDIAEAQKLLTILINNL